METVEAKKLCKEHMHRYVCVQMNDGMQYDGIMEHVDDDMIYLAVPVGPDVATTHANMAPNVAPNMMPNMAPNMMPNMAPNMMPNMAPNTMPCVNYPMAHARGYYPGYGYPTPYPYYGYGRRRFNRLVLPLFALTALTLLPYY